ncbi:MAG TPA: siphovirus Gp157 family protein [Candidatus Sulfotelmatobacter sp.]|nr:siphovirus Gp157 family protein [Candidatus Sulfotelmatobacter sp.]
MSAPAVTHHQSLWDIESTLAELISLRAEMQDSGEETAALDQQIVEYVRKEIIKADGIASYLRHCDMMAKAAQEEAERLTHRAKSWTERAKRLKTVCVSIMAAMGRSKIEGRVNTLAVQANGGRCPLTVTDESLLPDELCRWEGWITKDGAERIKAFLLPHSLKRVPDTEAIRKVLESKCLRCDGSGIVIDPNAIQLQQIPCPECDGSGHPVVAGARLEPRSFHLRIR